MSDASKATGATAASAAATPAAASTGGSSWASWWEQAQSQAKELAVKAQEMAEVASKVAQEKATELASKANEIRQNYDFESASALISSKLGIASSTVTGDGAIPTGGHGSASDGSDLDLKYLTENVIGMAFPYDYKTPQTQTGNNIHVVADFLTRKHGAGHFMVWNISEEGYDYGTFHNQVLEYKFPGHPAPPLGLLVKICTSVESWLDADERNVAVIHCLTGKGRTAALAACVLTWMGEFSSPIEALQYITEQKKISLDYLTIPSQRRYVQYFSNMLDGVRPSPEPLVLRRIIFSHVPAFGFQPQSPTAKTEADTANIGSSGVPGCCPYIQLFKCGKLVATAAPLLEHDHNSTANATPGEAQPRLQLVWLRSANAKTNASSSSTVGDGSENFIGDTSGDDGGALFSVDCLVQGDILVRCRHADPVSGARVSMFRAAFHTGYVQAGVLRLTKAQLDGANTDARFDDDFFLDFIFSAATNEKLPSNISGPVDGAAKISISSNNSAVISEGIGSVSVPAPAPTPSDGTGSSGTSSSDRYEQSLHRDARFWEAVTSRKARSKKRRSRKFVSSAQDQFSISDDRDLPMPPSLPASSAVEAQLRSELTRNAATIDTSGLSDEELILRLASSGSGSEELSPKASTAAFSSSSSSSSVGYSNSSTAAASNTSDVANELMALEDLEKELGLGDLGLFSTSSSSSSLGTKPANGGATDGSNGDNLAPLKGIIDDNLDELEKYLESLST